MANMYSSPPRINDLNPARHAITAGAVAVVGLVVAGLFVISPKAVTSRSAESPLPLASSIEVTGGEAGTGRSARNTDPEQAPRYPFDETTRNGMLAAMSPLLLDGYHSSTYVDLGTTRILTAKGIHDGASSQFDITRQADKLSVMISPENAWLEVAGQSTWLEADVAIEAAVHNPLGTFIDASEVIDIDSRTVRALFPPQGEYADVESTWVTIRQTGDGALTLSYEYELFGRVIDVITRLTPRPDARVVLPDVNA